MLKTTPNFALFGHREN